MHINIYIKKLYNLNMSNKTQKEDKKEDKESIKKEKEEKEDKEKRKQEIYEKMLKWAENAGIHIIGSNDIDITGNIDGS